MDHSSICEEMMAFFKQRFPNEEVSHNGAHCYIGRIKYPIPPSHYNWKDRQYRYEFALDHFTRKTGKEPVDLSTGAHEWVISSIGK